MQVFVDPVGRRRVFAKLVSAALAGGLGVLTAVVAITLLVGR